MFVLGQVVITPGARDTLTNEEGLDILSRHASGDWGDIHPEDRGLNDEAVRNGERIMSVYNLENGETIWIITEWDRSVTTILLPSEY